MYLQRVRDKVRYKVPSVRGMVANVNVDHPHLICKRSIKLDKGTSRVSIKTIIGSMP